MTQRPYQHGRVAPPAARRAGVTLVELAASLAIVSVLAVACGSAIMLATRASESAGALVTAPSAQEVVDQINSDLRLALAFTERTDTAVTLIVPDRDGDGSPDAIRYAWSGRAGDPLLRQYNGGVEAPVAEDVHHFALSYLLRTVMPQGPQEQESEETCHVFHDDAPGGKFRSLSFESGQLLAQYFRPTLPANAVRWKITRVVVMLSRSLSANILVQIRPADAAEKPTQQVIEQVSIPAASMPWGWVWKEIPFSSVSELDPVGGCCVVITSDFDEWSGQVQYEEGGSPMTPGTHLMTSTDGGGTWTKPNDDNDMRFYVYGTVTTLEEP